MKKILTMFFQMLVILIGIAALVFMLWEPHMEGRNAHATLYQIYFNDPFLAYAYIASIAFFVAVYQTFKLLGYIRQDKIFSQASIKSLRTIKYCAMTLIVFILGAEFYFFTVQRGQDDIAGGVALGLFMIFISVIVAITATAFEKRLQKH